MTSFPIFIGGQEWTVRLVASSHIHLGRGKYDGRCLYDKCRIYINKSLDQQNREDTLLHEILHALLHVSGARNAYDADVETEEVMVTAVTPMLHRLLKDFGLQFPSFLSK